MSKDIKEKKDRSHIIANKLIRSMKISVDHYVDSSDLESSVFEKIKTKIAKHSISKRLYNAWRIGAVAASLLLVSVLSLFLYTNSNAKPSELVLLSNLSSANKLYVLPDSSTVLLRPNSQITYIQGNTIPRDIVLSGMGFFEIAPDKAHPFTIQTDAGTVRVLGTKFGLKSSANSVTTELTLTEGSVEFLSGGLSYKVKPNERILIDKQTGNIDIEEVDPNFVLAWRSDYLEFTNETLINVMKCIADIHQVNIHVHDSILAQTRFTGRLNNKYEIEKILKDLSLIIQIKYTETNNTYLIETNQ